VSGIFPAPDSAYHDPQLAIKISNIT